MKVKCPNCGFEDGGNFAAVAGWRYPCLPLTYDDLTHYQKVIVALMETIRLMTEIDELIPGWPVE
jgi:hypothetical protein